MSQLYLDYLYSFGKVSRFYGSPYRPYELVSAPSICVAHTLEYYPGNRRQRVAQILERQNRRLDASKDVFASIEKFKNPHCCAIVTGQEVGLFGGPLFTVFKTLAAVRLAQEFQSKGLEVVPIFWINDIDHDFDEVNHCYLLDAKRKIVEVRYQGSPEHTGRSVGHIRLGKEIETTLDLVENTLSPTEFRSHIMECLRKSYRQGLSYSEGFSRTLLEIFRGQGLIMIDPLDRAFQEMVAPVYRKAITDSETLSRAICTRNNELKAAGYHAQIHTDSHTTFLFATHNKKRRALQRFDSHFRLKGTEVELSNPDILAWADVGSLTPNAALRPVVQDFLLPTAVYIGGPSEVAYFAQLAPLYQHFERPMPVIFPRPSFTLVDDSIRKVADRYQMELVDFMAADTEVIDRAFNRLIPDPVEKALAAIEEGIPAQFESLRPALAELDPTLAQALDRAKQKVMHQLVVLRTKLVHAEARGHTDVAREIRSCLTTLFPKNNLQEREINVLMFMARFGPTLIQKLYDQIDLSNPDHHIVSL